VIQKKKGPTFLPTVGAVEGEPKRDSVISGIPFFSKQKIVPFFFRTGGGALVGILLPEKALAFSK
jgi:hypothetical protein